MARKDYKQVINSSDKEIVKEKIAQEKTAKARQMLNKGIGPVQSVRLAAQIDQGLVKKGEDLYKRLCSVCHEIDKKSIGPPFAGIMERLSPEWIMNMILNPEQMEREDAIVQELSVAYYGVVMFSQNLTEGIARLILEYFRTL